MPASAFCARTVSPAGCRSSMSRQHKHQRYSKRRAAADGMKLHLRLLKVRGVDMRVITLRPHTEASFSTNYYHATWHILSDQHGAKLLGRLLWGLSYQSKRGTAILLHGEHIKPTPFGAEPSNPILLFVSGHASTHLKHLRALRRRINQLGRSGCSLRLKSFGLDAALDRESAAREVGEYQPEFSELHYSSSDSQWRQEQMFCRGGFVCYTAPAEVMRMRAMTISQLDPTSYGMDYYFLAEDPSYRWPDGEVQIFSDYRQRSQAAEQARREVLSSGQQFDTPEQLYEVVASKRNFLLRKRQANKKKRRVRERRKQEPAARQSHRRTSASIIKAAPAE